ncbi:MAG: bifunctional (p)ppGpp synthetase/guanosine-3',5'-bis(diphosphate) 3'-pyrophosphohydrolase [Rhodobacterales bacterium]|nr:bifunctional (p)ppGpp synthetase/guanosine-3',5'-bis(diphosphate) 3'-pyrophosphohydrolase [Rhodobacterales bacterium]
MSRLHSVLLLSILAGSTAYAAVSDVDLHPIYHADADQRALDGLLDHTEALLAEHHIHATVTARVKSPDSVLAKMERKGIGIQEIYDHLALRIRVDSEADCYIARALIEDQHAVIATERDDYIANPKANGYQSLHSAVRTNLGTVAEFQFRTHAMHIHAENGDAAHSAYKQYGQA